MKLIFDLPGRIAMGLLAAMPTVMGGATAQAGDVEVDLALVLAIDCSASVNDREFALQTAVVFLPVCPQHFIPGAGGFHYASFHSPQ